jgi:hypothetical protein
MALCRLWLRRLILDLPYRTALGEGLAEDGVATSPDVEGFGIVEFAVPDPIQWQTKFRRKVNGVGAVSPPMGRNGHLFAGGSRIRKLGSADDWEQGV